jgi:predicted RNase H-like nuclease (RuvC/YqgF family)
MNSKDWLEENKQGFQEGWSRYFKTCEQIKQTCTDAQRELKQVREHMREDCEMQLEHMRAENQRQSAEHQLQIKTMQDQQQLEIAMKDNTIKMLQEKLADQTARCDAFSKKFNQMASIFKKTFWMQDIDTPQ